MQAEHIETAIRDRLRDRWLLDHPFYRRWTAGDVTIEELRAYAAQYRHFEAMVPAHLRAVAEVAEQPALREQALRNLADEAGTAPTHLELFERFASALGAPSHADPSPAMTHLLDTYSATIAAGASAGSAAMLAYEMQAPDVSATKADGLRRHGILDGDALAFWDVHAGMDRDHSAWALEALAVSGTDEDVVVGAAGSAADAWWAFLDEREALRA